jgi:ABC-type nitrate/sulfonate/bicarbonate transport system permease component
VPDAVPDTVSDSVSDAAESGPSGNGSGAAAPVRREPSRADRDMRGYVRRQRQVERGLAIGVPVLIVLAWWGGTATGAIDTRFFPSPSTVWDTAWELIREGELQEQVWVTTKRVIPGFLLGVVTGGAVGVLLGVSRLSRAALEPTLSALYTVPKLAFLPALLLIFKFGDTPKILVVAITVFFFMWISTMTAVATVPAGYREALQSFGASRWQMFRHVLLPASLPQIFVAMRLSAGISVLTIVGVEFVQGGTGIGDLIWKSWQMFLPGRTYVGIVTVALFGLVFSMLIQLAGRRCTPWAPNERAIGPQ